MGAKQEAKPSAARERAATLGRVQRIVSPGRGLVAGAIALQVAAFGVLVGLLIAQVLADRRRGMQVLSEKAWLLIPFSALLASEVLRRWTGRRLFVVHEHGFSFPEGRRTRMVRWDEIERVELGPGTCKLSLRDGGAAELSSVLARNEAVREALRVGVKKGGRE